MAVREITGARGGHWSVPWFDPESAMMSRRSWPKNVWSDQGEDQGRPRARRADETARLRAVTNPSALAEGVVEMSIFDTAEARGQKTSRLAQLDQTAPGSIEAQSVCDAADGAAVDASGRRHKGQGSSARVGRKRAASDGRGPSWNAPLGRDGPRPRAAKIFMGTPMRRSWPTPVLALWPPVDVISDHKPDPGVPKGVAEVVGDGDQPAQPQLRSRPLAAFSAGGPTGGECHVEQSDGVVESRPDQRCRARLEVRLAPRASESRLRLRTSLRPPRATRAPQLLARWSPMPGRYVVISGSPSSRSTHVSGAASRDSARCRSPSSPRRASLVLANVNPAVGRPSLESSGATAGNRWRSAHREPRSAACD